MFHGLTRKQEEELYRNNPDLQPRKPKREINKVIQFQEKCKTSCERIAAEAVFGKEKSPIYYIPDYVGTPGVQDTYEGITSETLELFILNPFGD